MEAQPPIPTEALLAHSEWVRRLARSLVFDADRADDVVQETWRAALESPPRSQADLRTWLAVVARNAARSLGRGEQRRRVREALAARAEALPDAMGVLEKARLQKRVTDAVLELDEPYRTTLLLRHFEELKPAEIARRLGRPVNTVRTHVERGHAKLRARLDEEFGGREAWGLALLPLARLSEGAMTSAALVSPLGGIAVLLKWTLVASLALVGWFAVSRLASPEAPLLKEEAALVQGSAPAADPAPDVAGPAAPEAAEAADRREELGAAPTSTPAAPAAPASAVRTTVAGRVVDASGADLAGLRLRFVNRSARRLAARLAPDRGTAATGAPGPEGSSDPRPEPDGARPRDAAGPRPEDRTPASVTLTSGADGRFEGALPFETYDVVADDEDLELIGTGPLALPGGGEETLHVVVPVAPVAGRVLEQDGAPAAGVRLTADVTLDGIHGFPYVLQSSDSFQRWTIGPTAPDGRFRHGRLPVVPGLLIYADAGPRGSAQTSVEALGRESIELRLRVWNERDPYLVTGRVLDPAGLPVEGARVLFSQQEARTDREGRFALEVGHLVDDSRVFAVKAGHAPAFLDGLEARLREDRLAGQGLLLRTGGPTRSIRGRVVDEAGAPVWNARVYLVGGDPLGNLFSNVEDALGGRGSAGVRTDGRGRFVYDGLYQASYGLRAFQPDTFLSCSVGDVVPGGEEVELVLPTSDLLPLLRGRVVDRAGRPVEAAELRLGFVTFADARWGTSSVAHDLGTTAADGGFEFRDVPHRGLDLRVGGAGIESSTFPLDPRRATELELVVELRLRFQLDRQRFDGFESFEAVDAAGERVTVTEYRSGVTSFRDRVRLNDDPTWPTFEVSDGAVALVFEGAETLRVPLELSRSEVVVVR